MSPAPAQDLWGVVSRASGIIAVALVSLSVLIGLAMAARVVPPARKRGAVALHEVMATVALAAIAVHGAALLGDRWLRPGVAGITIPFVLGYRPGFTAAGIVAGYVALLLGPSFYARRRLGTRTWRRLHRATPLVWVLAAVHTLGSGSDAGTLWLRLVVLAPVVPATYLLVLRVFGTGRRSPARPPSRARPVRRLTTVPVDDSG